MAEERQDTASRAADTATRFVERESRDAVNRAPAAGGTITRLAMRESQVWADVQRELLTGARAIWVESLKRRSAVIDAANRSLRELCSCRTFGEAAQIQQRWLADTMQRTVDDVGRLTSDAAALTQRVANIAAEGVAGAAQTVPEAVRKAAE